MNSFAERFFNYTSTQHILSKSQDLLIAVSGGVDSMVLFHLLQNFGYRGIVAHCNFHLRGNESDREEAFTKKQCSDAGFPVITKHFNTREYAEMHSLSIEMAARELRYKWFNEELQARGLSVVVTGHHLDDQIETFFINLARGTGLKGLAGMKPLKGYIARPLLFATRKEILQYAHEHNIPYKEDSSNARVEIKRNLIRHEVVPVMEQVNTGFHGVMQKNMHHLSESYQILRKHIMDTFDNITRDDAGILNLPLKSIEQLHPLRAYLFEFLSPYGFHGDVVDQLMASLHHESGKRFYSRDYRIVKDRGKLLISTIPAPIQAIAWNAEAPLHVVDPFGKPNRLEADIPERMPGQENLSRQEAYLDYDRIQLPLTVRTWKKGDRFFPSGMRGKKKVKDFFTDQKMAIPEKERTWILESAGEIIWIAGKRIDERFKASRQTKTILRITLRNA